MSKPLSEREFNRMMGCKHSLSSNLWPRDGSSWPKVQGPDQAKTKWIMVKCLRCRLLREVRYRWDAWQGEWIETKTATPWRSLEAWRALHDGSKRANRKKR